MSHNIQLGQLLDSLQNKDAIHVAVASVVADETLAPGAPIDVHSGYRASRARTGQGVAVVDPFLENHVQPGEKFWALVRPGTVKNLRHEWSHDSFSDSPDSDDEAYESCRGC
jgi:hypothetical protein